MQPRCHVDHTGLWLYDSIAVHARPLRENDKLLPRFEHAHALLEGIDIALTAFNKNRPGLFHKPTKDKSRF